MDNDKIDQHSDEIEVESEEKERGKKIEIDEDRLPSRAMAIHEHIRQDGEKELERDAMALLWSAIAAGLSMGASLLAKGIFHVELEGVPGSFLLENLGYTFGFIIVIMARQQLFTENTVTAVLPVMQKPTMSNVGLLMRLWGIVLLGNIIGTGIAAWAFEYMPIFNEETRDAFVKIGMDVMKKIREINRRNRILKSKYKGDERFVRIHKRIEEQNEKREKPIISKQEYEIAENLANMKQDIKPWKFREIVVTLQT